VRSRRLLNLAAWLLWLLIVQLARGAEGLPRPEKLSPAFHRNRLDELYRRCPDGLALLRGEVSWYRKRELRNFDSTYADFNFKQEKNLYYLTGIEVPDSFVLIDPKKKEVRLYSDWKGKRELQELKKLDYVSGPFPAAQFLYDVRLRADGYSVLYTLYEPVLRAGTLYGKTAALSGIFPPGMGEPVTEETQFARKLAEIFPSERVVSIYPILLDMQKIKQPEEIRLLRRANEIAAQGVVEGLKSVRPGLYDHDIAAVMEYVFVRRGSVAPTFAFNVMSGPNLFQNLLPLWSDYYHLDRQMKAGEGVFLDVGAEVGYYVSDIGRTAPVSGKFSSEQKAMYEAYLPCFLKAEQGVRPGITQRELVKLCVSCARTELSKVNDSYLKSALEDFVRELESHSSLGHYQDMNVLGAGPGDDEPLQPGMVFAIEPILYSRQQNFGVFLEDVILVTDSGYDVLSRGMPYSAEEVEAIMGKRSIIEAADDR
jgi:Xaa-Pro aminopeptidase